MSVLRYLTLLSLPLIVMGCNAEKETATAEASTHVEVVDTAFDKQAIMDKFTQLGANVVDVKESEVTGLVEVETAGGTLFASADGQYFFMGTLYQIGEDGKYVDVMAMRQAPENAKKLESVSDSVIEFKADEEKYVVTVFTDITCGYCVRLHNQIGGYNDLGITVRYMAYPRQGATGSVADQMAAIWCADDQQTAMHDAKINRQSIDPNGDMAQCKETVAKHYNLGRSLGISGTPSIFLPSGEMVGGYVPPAELLNRLN